MSKNICKQKGNHQCNIHCSSLSYHFCLTSLWAHAHGAGHPLLFYFDAIHVNKYFLCRGEMWNSIKSIWRQPEGYLGQWWWSSLRKKQKEKEPNNHCQKKYKSYGEHGDDSVPTLKQTLLSDSGALQHSGSHSSSIQGCCLYWQHL